LAFAQRKWLMAMRDHLSVHTQIPPRELMDAPEFSGRGEIVRAKAPFGARDFLPDGIPGESPAEPDPQVFFDE
jgi:hypothetical protein